MKKLDFTLCNSVMNRDDDLERAIPTWLKLPFRHCIIVDWSSTNPVWESFKHLMDERFTVIRVDNETVYPASIVHNLSIKYVQTEWVFRVDSDVIANDLCIFDAHPHCFYTGDVTNNWGLAGTCLFRKEIFDKTGGYDENMRGYGYEDITFYRRMQHFGITKKNLPKYSLTHLDHDDEKRSKYRGIDSISESRYKMSCFRFDNWCADDVRCEPTFSINGRNL